MSDIAKLPKWAQQLISRLEYEVREKDVALDAYKRDAEQSRIVADYMSPIERTEVYIPERGLSSVRFYTGNYQREDGISCSLDVHYPGWLLVDCNDLELRPTASNRVLIREGSRDE